MNAVWIITVILLFYGIRFLGNMAYDKITTASAARTYRETYDATPAEVDGLSNASRDLLELRASLPVESRPHTDFPSMLRALDIKYGGAAEVNEHFGHRNEYYRLNARSLEEHSLENCSCSGTFYNTNKFRGCRMGEYRKLKQGIDAINHAIAERERAIQLAAVAGQLESVSATIEAMREESALINNITKEITA